MRSTSLADRAGHCRSRSTVSRPFRKQQISTSTPESSGPTASIARSKRSRAASAMSVRSAETRRHRPSAGRVSTLADQFAVTRGCSRPISKSRRSRSAAATACGASHGAPPRVDRASDADRALGDIDEDIVTGARYPPPLDRAMLHAEGYRLVRAALDPGCRDLRGGKPARLHFRQQPARKEFAHVARREL